MKKSFLLLMVVFSLLVGSCRPAPMPTPTLEPTVTPSPVPPTPTPVPPTPTFTPTLEPTVTPAKAPTSTPTPVPSTPTPIPTPPIEVELVPYEGEFRDEIEFLRPKGWEKERDCVMEKAGFKMVTYYHEGMMFKVFWFPISRPGPRDVEAELIKDKLESCPWITNIRGPFFKKNGFVSVYDATGYEGHEGDCAILRWQKSYSKVHMGFEWICFCEGGDFEACWASRPVLWDIVKGRHVK